MKKIILFLSFLVFTFHLIGQPVWIWQNPYPPAANFLSISMIDTTEGWMTVGTNSLMHYYNGQWNCITIPPSISMVNPSSIFFLSHNLGWVGSYSGVYRFNGITWQKIIGTYSGIVKDLFFFSQNNGWAILSGGNVLQISGLNGTNYNISSKELNAISFPDSSHGWAVGDSGTIMSYYGGNWYTWPAITNHKLYDVYFSDLTHGWAVGNCGTILYFNGSNWQIQNSGANFNITTIDFVDPQHGYAAGFNDTIIFYNGTSWSYYSTAPNYILSIDMVNQSRGFAAGYMGAVMDIIANNVSTSFTQQNLTNNELDGMYFKDHDHGWAVGSFGTMLTYTQGTWNTLDPEITNSNLWGVHFPDLQHGWCVGAGGTIISYNHGNWYGQPSGTGNNLLGVNFVDSLNGWAVGQFGTILHYHNDVWVPEVSHTDSALLSVFFTDTTNGWAVGEYGTIVHYTNGIWQPYHSGRGAFLNSVYFLSPNNGWAVGDSGMIMHYNGINWQVDTCMPFAPWKFLRSVCFVTADNGWAVGMQSLYHYDGYSWTDYSYTLPTAYNFNAISFPDEGNGWIAGEYGNVLFCKSPSTIETEIPNIPEMKINNEVYPNPTSDKLNIQFKQFSFSDKIDIEIFDIQGRTLLRKRISKEKTDIDISAFEKGVYILKINFNEKTEVTKFVKD